jgi:hypothetical protein
MSSQVDIVVKDCVHFDVAHGKMVTYQTGG